MDTALSLVLAGVFLMGGFHHVVSRSLVERASQSLWFGTMCLCAAGFALAHALGAPRMEMLACTGWSIAAGWFLLAYLPDTPDTPVRRYAGWILASAFVVALILMLSGPAGSRHAGTTALLYASIAIGVAGLGMLVVVAGTILWTSRRLVRFMMLVGLGLAICSAVFNGLAQGRDIAVVPFELVVFAVVAMIASYEYVSGVAEARVSLQRQRQEIAHASRLSIVGELTASIAHEINQPLGAILSNADAGEILLESGDGSLDEVRRILGDIRRDGLRASDVIRHVRALVQKREFEPVKVDAQALVSSVAALLKPEATRRRMTIAVASSGRSHSLLGDPALLEQVLINLILNAMDALEIASSDAKYDNHAPITMEVAASEHDEVEIRVADAGPGIPPERLAHLFDSFYTSKEHGMGLGLSIARSIVEKHGGRIVAQNNRDKGATFRLLLPPHPERTAA
ncbi:MAG: ATP-binding protein [Pseudoxanthomonas sp.]